MSQREYKFVIAASGASGAIYGRELLRAIASSVPGESSLIVSAAALRVYNQELKGTLRTPQEYLDANLNGIAADKRVHSFRILDHADIGAKAASGSTPSDGMIICPCSMKTLAGIAHGYTSNLIERAADVCLKERRRLVVVPRETPYSLIHLRNMTQLTEAGGIVLPGSPGFYQNPRTLDDLGRFIAGRILSLFDIHHSLYEGWEGED